jgi:hypothetical protein
MSLLRKRTSMDSTISQIVFYVVLFLACAYNIISVSSKFPLFPFNMDSLEWSNAWLIATIGDYYGACLCFCGVVISSESTWTLGILWSLGCCLLGSPVCCLWTLLYLWNGGGTLRLDRQRGSHTLI